LVIASIASAQAFGQTAPDPSAEPVEVDEIVVTGSRIARSDFSSTSPIVTVGQEAIAQSGTVNIEQALNQLPQFVQGQTSSTVGAVALAGRASLNLRGLGETRNLVLLDGRRLPLSNANAVVDVNLIPQFILSGVEIGGLRIRRHVGCRQLQEPHRFQRRAARRALGD
jgi:iron complex outermembrane receptor protein